MSNIIETSFGKIDVNRMANGTASNITKQGAFYIFSIRLNGDDVREYSFTNRDRAVSMRRVLVSHMEQKMRLETKRVISA